MHKRINFWTIITWTKFGLQLQSEKSDYNPNLSLIWHSETAFSRCTFRLKRRQRSNQAVTETVFSRHHGGTILSHPQTLWTSQHYGIDFSPLCQCQNLQSQDRNLGTCQREYLSQVFGTNSLQVIELLFYLHANKSDSGI